MNQPTVPVWFAATVFVVGATLNFVVAGGHAAGIPDLYLFALAAVNTGVGALAIFLNIRKSTP